MCFASPLDADPVVSQPAYRRVTTFIDARSGDRSLEDALDRGVEHRVELVVRLLGAETLGQGPGEAGDHTSVPGEASVGLFSAVSTREGYDPQHLGVLDQLGVKAVLVREGELEHDLCA